MKNLAVTGNKMIDYAFIGIVFLLGGFLLLELALSISWRMEVDSPILHYVAFLIDEHYYIPYKDIFDTSMPGTYLFHLAIGKLFGYGDLAFRIVDIILLLYLLAITFFMMSDLSIIVGLSSSIIFGILYLGYGPTMSLQRDYVGIIPIATALFLVKSSSLSKRRTIKAFVIGALFALSSSIKPHLAIGLPALITYISLNVNLEGHKGQIWFFRSWLKFCFFTALGFILILSLPFLWLWSKGGFPYFWDMFSNYIPLYIQLTSDHRVISGFTRTIYLFVSYQKLGGMQILLVPTALGTYIAFSVLEKKPAKIKFVLLLLGLLFLYSIYPVFAGQFWPYHWMPFIYFGSLCASLLLLSTKQVSSSLYQRVIPLVVFLFFLLIGLRPSSNFLRQVSGLPPAPPTEGRVDEIANFLTKDLQPTDKVQPLDWTGGAVYGMLISEAVVATPYIYDSHFYLHSENQYILNINKNLIKNMKRELPRFIIDVDPSKKAGIGYGRIYENGIETFTELKNILENNYETVYEGNGFKIMERKNITP